MKQKRYKILKEYLQKSTQFKCLGSILMKENDTRIQVNTLVQKDNYCTILWFRTVIKLDNCFQEF